jgi:hypothetical protein
MASALPLPTTLSGLSNNALGNKTAGLVGELLATASALEELDLSWNQIKVGWKACACLEICTDLIRGRGPGWGAPWLGEGNPWWWVCRLRLRRRVGLP